MNLRLRIALCVVLAVFAGLVVSASCAAMSKPDDFAVGFGMLGLLATFVLLPWCFIKILRRKGKANA